MLVRKLNLWHLLLIGTGIFLNAAIVNSSEIQVFGFLGAEGQINIDYLSEDNFTGKIDENQNAIGPSTDQERQVIQQNLEVLFHTFIYHPNFVKFDFGFGLVFTQNKVDDYELDINNNVVPHESIDASDNALDLNFRLSFFEKKDYPFSLFYVQKHPSINAVSSDAFISESTRYGANFLWNAPIRINFDVIHYDIKGESNLRIVNDQVDSTTLGAYKSFKNDGHVQLTYAHQVTTGNSGSAIGKNSIVETKNTTDSVNYDSRYNYGDNREYNFNLAGSYRQNRDSFEYDEIVIAPSFNWKHSEKLKSLYRYSYNSNLYAERKNTIHSADAGITYSAPNGFSTRFDANLIHSELTGASSDLLGIKNTTSYRHSFKHADFSITMLLGINESESVVDVSISPAQETFNMPAAGKPKVLARRNIVGSFELTSTNRVDGNKVLLKFVKDKDYKINDEGNGKFSIEVLTSSLILTAGEPVLLVYKVDNGSDNKFRRTTKGLNSSLQFFNYFNVYGGISRFDVKVLAGTVSKTLVTQRTAIHGGAGVDYPLFEDYLLIGGEVRQENVDEDFITTKTASELAYMQINLFRGASLYLSRRHSTVVYTGIDTLDNNDTDKLAYRALFKIQTSRRANLSLIYDDSTDVGNIAEINEVTETSLRFEWAYRRLLLRVTGSTLNDQRGDRLRERKAIQFNLVRTF